MIIHILQHTPDCPSGSILEWIEKKGHKAQVIKLFEGESLPAINEVEFLVILGGRMNVDDTEIYPWLAQEKEFLRDAIRNKKTCLGICLGGQLLAQVLGAQVRKNEHWEIGWHGVLVGSDQRLTVFQWHEDTFDIPPGAVRVAKNRITENQAFAYGNNVVGLQFHPEVTEEWVRAWAAKPDIPEGPHVQKPDMMLADIILIGPMKKWLFSLLDRLEAITAQKVV